jgi:hypothetical protein
MEESPETGTDVERIVALSDGIFGVMLLYPSAVG